MNTVIIAGAGSGTRFGSERPKQFVEVLGKPIICYAIDAFESCGSINSIVVVVSADRVKAFTSTARKLVYRKVSAIVAGGRERFESVQNGLAAVDQSAEVIAVHDAARPLVTVFEIDAVIATAASSGAACLTLPVSDTIKQVSGGLIDSTLDRRNLRRAVTPQAFRSEILRRAVATAAATADELVTDESRLVERLGIPVAAVDASPTNIKVTYPHDLVFCEAILTKRASSRA